MIPIIIVIVILAVIAFALIGIYNGLVQLRVRADNAWADIDVQLKRRYDLIPNLVETAKGEAERHFEALRAGMAGKGVKVSYSVDIRNCGPRSSSRRCKVR